MSKERVLKQFKDDEGTTYIIKEIDISKEIDDSIRVRNEKSKGNVICPLIAPKGPTQPVEVVTLNEVESECFFSINLFNKLLNHSLNKIFNE